MSRRAVITGIGVVAPTGVGREPYWAATRDGRAAIRRITRFDPSPYDTQLAGEVRGFEPREYLPQQVIVQADRGTWMALAATQMALEDAALDPKAQECYRLSVVTGSSSGGNEFGQKEIHNLWGKGPIFVSAYQSIAWFYAASAGQISIRHGLKGPCGVVVTEGAAGLDALAHARRTIRRGVDAVVTGGTEAPLCPYGLVCYMRSGQLSRATNPCDAYRPFDRTANGYVPGEGGAMLLVEDLEFARTRGAPQLYAEILGYAATQDAYHPSRHAPDGRQLARAIAGAVRDAGIAPRDVDAIFADGWGTLEADAIEVGAITSVFGASATTIPVTAPKSMVGRLCSGGAALDVATAMLAVRDGVIPPTVNLHEPPDRGRLDFVIGEARPLEPRTVLVIARGFGGFNSVMVLRKVDQ